MSCFLIFLCKYVATMLLLYVIMHSSFSIAVTLCVFFQVNTSGQFVGIAEMVGPVDFDKTVDYWQQDKWNGCFSIKWHVVKDIPNNILKHITLENNDNKPVTNSRDTQEVCLLKTTISNCLLRDVIS